MIESTSDIARLRILATSDLHMHLLPHDYLADAATPGKGLQSLALLIARLRGEAGAETPPRHVMLVDNGDTLQGNVLGDHIATRMPRDGVHPVAELMNALGYDAMGLGNHDFDYGLSYLDWFSRSLDAPVLSSNTRLGKAEDWLSAQSLRTVGEVTVGILSVLPPRTVKALKAQIGDAARFDDMVETVLKTAEDLRSAGADIVLALAHTGIDPGNEEQVLTEIAQTGAVDALVGGHQHGVFPGPSTAEITADPEHGTLFGIPTVMPGCNGALLGCIDLDLERGPDGWTVVHASGRVLPPETETSPEAPRAFASIRRVHDAACAELGTVIADTPIPLTTYFARVHPTATHALIAAAQQAAIDAERQGTRHAGLPLLSAVSLPRAGGTGGPDNYTDIPAGPVTLRNLAELSVYANQIWAVRMTGAEIAEWLEKAASAFARVGHAGSEGLIDTDIPAFDFDVIHGLSYEVDPSAPARYDRLGQLCHPENHRITRLEHDGKPVAPETEFLVAVNSFRACGGGKFPGLHSERPVLRPDISTADAIRSCLTSGAAQGGAADWRFSTSCAGIATWFDTGPGAERHLHEIAHLAPGAPQPQPSGFLRIPITL